MNKKTRRSRTSALKDVEIGQRVRASRRATGMSQEALGEALGLTFQQIQKYEKGTNRIGAGQLEEIAKILGVPVASFFSVQSTEEKQSSNTSNMNDALQSTQLVRNFVRIKDEGVRKVIVELLDRLGG